MPDFANEEWRAIPGYEGIYSASNFGRIRSEERIVYYGDHRSHRIDPQKIKKPSFNTAKTHYYMTLTKDGVHKRWAVHILVMLAFVGRKPEKMDTRHLDGNGLNNKIENLCYGSRAENIADAKQHGTFRIGEKCTFSKLSNQDAIDIVLSPLSYKEVARNYGIHPFDVHRIRRGDRWGDITKEARKKQPERIVKNKFNSLCESHYKILKDFSISQRKAAMLIGVPQRTIWRWRNADNTIQII